MNASSIFDDDVDNEREQQSTSLTNTQEKILSLLPILPSILSITGSCGIIYFVYNSKKRTVYERILFGMSIADILQTTGFVLRAFLMPRETSHRVWAIGNYTTCTAIGFLWQCSFSALLYNAMLSYYFMLTIRFGLAEEILLKRFEPIAHIFAIGYPLVSAIITAFRGAFQEMQLGFGCWIGPEEGQLGAIFGAVPVFFTFTSILGNNAIVFYHVRDTINRGRRNSIVAEIDPSSSITRGSSQNKRINDVAMQCFFYLLAYISMVIGETVLRFFEDVGQPPSEESRLWALRRVIFGNSVAPTKRKTRTTRQPAMCATATEGACSTKLASIVANGEQENGDDKDDAALDVYDAFRDEDEC